MRGKTRYNVIYNNERHALYHGFNISDYANFHFDKIISKTCDAYNRF